MLKTLMVLLVLASFKVSIGQVAINTSGATPNASAMLDVSSTNKGILIPSVSLTNTALASPVATPATGLLIWNSNASIVNGSGTGFYFWDGAAWRSLLGDNSGWRLQGNAGTNPSLQFVGTTDAQPLVFRVNNGTAGKIDYQFNNLFFGNGSGRNVVTTGSISSDGLRNTFYGDSTGYNNTTGDDNSYFGYRAGRLSTIQGQNSFFGTRAGEFNNGSSNSFFGHAAGRVNISTSNSFFGVDAGTDNTSGGNNSFFGRSSGANNQSGDHNCFIGNSAGNANISGSFNNFLGSVAGFLSTGDANNMIGYNAGLFNSTGSFNTFFGHRTGLRNGAGNWNTFVGDSAGWSNSSGSLNTMVGSGAISQDDDLDNSAAIGAKAQVNLSNSMVLGSIAGINGATADINVGIGTPAPLYRFHVVSSRLNDGGWADGILVENTAPLASAGETAISFRNSTLPANKRWSVGQNQNPNLSFNYGISFNGAFTKMVIDTLGNVGVGTINPAALLDIDGTTKIGTNGTALNDIIRDTISRDLPTLAPAISATETFTINNAQVGSSVHVSPGSAIPNGVIIAWARVASAGNVEVNFINVTAGNINPSNMNFYFTVIR